MDPTSAVSAFTASRFWTEPGYRPVMLHLSKPSALPTSSRSCRLGGPYRRTSPASRDQRQRARPATRSVPPPLRRGGQEGESSRRALIRPPCLPREVRDGDGAFVARQQGTLRGSLQNGANRTGQNFLHQWRSSCFAPTSDLALISERLSAWASSSNILPATFQRTTDGAAISEPA